MTRLLLVLLIAISASLFVGIMIGTAGGAIYTPLYRAAAPFTCDGDFLITSQSYSYRPGQSGVEHMVLCRDPQTGAQEEITTYAVLVATLVYAALSLPATILLTLIISRRIGNKRAEASAAGLSGTWQTTGIDFGGSAHAAVGAHTVFFFNGRSYANPEEMPAEARAAYEKVLSVFADKDGDNVPDLLEKFSGNAFAQSFAEQTQQPEQDPSERLSKLKALRDAGLITEEEYEAKRAEILSEL